MAHPPVTKAHIPVTIRQWRAELAGWRRYKKRAAKHLRDQGPVWVKKQLEYVDQRIEDLLDNAPGILVVRGEARMAREDQIV